MNALYNKMIKARARFIHEKNLDTAEVYLDTIDKAWTNEVIDNNELIDNLRVIINWRKNAQ